MDLDWKSRAAAYCCNGRLIKRLRRQLGWTQYQLASVAGYSERVVRKAESGASISVDTIADLADALSQKDQDIHPAELICDPLRLTEQFIDSLNIHREDVIPHVQHFLKPNVIFRQAGDPAVIPFAGEHVGIDGADQMFKCFFQCLERPADKEFAPEYLMVGNEVLVLGEDWSHPRGRPLEKPMWVVLRFTYEDGMLAMYDGKFDTDYGRRVLADSVRSGAPPHEE